MHTMQMLLAVTPVFFVALFLLCFYRDRLKQHPMINHLFVIACAAFFFCWNYAAYEWGWLEDGFMTLENISPFICTVILFSPFLGQKVRDFAHATIAFLAFGMFLALFISPGAEYLSSYRYTATFMNISEAACHLVMALYGYYLVLCNKVEINFKSFIRSAIFIYASILFGVFLNWCFHLNNFGMDMYGGYSIYFLDIFGSFAATFVAYLVGVFGTILLGYISAHFVDWVSSPAQKEE